MPDTLILCYHAVSPTWPADLSTTPERFERQLAALARRGYRGVTFADAVAGGTGRRVAVTFDDAYRSVLRLARPILDRAGFPATVFAPTAFVGGEQPMSWPGIDHWLGGPHESELVPMSWDELRELADAGWEIGSHTVSHPRLTALPDDALARELRESRAALEEGLARPCATVAYPYGDVDDRVTASARDAGYKAGAGLPAAPHAERPLDWPRVGIYYGDGDRRFALKASPLVRRLRGSAALSGAVSLARRAGRR